MAPCCLETNEHLPLLLPCSPAPCPAPALRSRFPLWAERKRIFNLKDFYPRGLTEGEGGGWGGEGGSKLQMSSQPLTQLCICSLLTAGLKSPLSYDSPPHIPTPPQTNLNGK